MALANAGADTNGSQFFIVYGNTTLPASYTILGTVSGDGMKVVDGIAAQGVQNGAQDGPPVATTDIAKVTVPGDALEGTGTYVTASRRPATDGLSTDGLSTGGATLRTGRSPEQSVPKRRRRPPRSPRPTRPQTTGGAG